MGSRLELQALLEDLLGSRNVYYQPPATIKMEYPAIVYSINNIRRHSADNKLYTMYKNYQIIVMDRLPDNPVIEKIMQLPMASYVRNYKVDNLNHDVLELYY